jgi:pimeloyl-ACP methyl ester carboxylesterase
MRTVELRVDLPSHPALGESLHTAVSVHLPDPGALAEDPIVLFCWPGGGYAKEYSDVHGSGLAGYSQAAHHVARGLVVVAGDHLGSGASSEPNRSGVTFENLAAANRGTVEEVLRRLREGEISADVPPLRPRAVLGAGQSYGGLLLIVQQGRQRTFDGIAVLGFCATGVVLPQPHGNVTTAAGGVPVGEMSPRQHMRWFFHWEDVPAEIVEPDMAGEHPTRADPLPMWASDRRPGGPSVASTAPRIVDHWAATIECPVFIGVGQRDVVPDPRAEPAAYRCSSDVTLVITPRMGHMHNFAGTRALLWDRLAAWTETVAAVPAAARQVTS